MTLVLAACLTIPVSSAIAARLFHDLGTLGVSGLRMAIAAVVLLAATRPAPHRVPPAARRGVLPYGGAMAGMNVLFYNAVARRPLGVAVTLEFLGPFVVTFLGIHGRREVALPALALAGVALVSHPNGGMSATGLGFGLGAAGAFGGHTLLAGRVGSSSPGYGGLALSVTVAALVLLPFSVAAVPRVHGPGASRCRGRRRTRALENGTGRCEAQHHTGATWHDPAGDQTRRGAAPARPRAAAPRP